MLKRIILSIAMTIAVGFGFVSAAPDLAITSNTLSLPGYGGSGDSVAISISFTNSGTSVATGGSVSYTLPGELSFATVPAGWNVIGQTATLTGDFANGVTVNTGFTATINNFYSFRTVTGTVTSSVAGDLVASNNTLAGGVQLGYAFDVQKVVATINGASPHSGQAIQGDVIEFSLAVINSGTVPLAVNLTDTVSGISEMTFAQSVYSQVYSQILPGGSNGFNFTGTVTAASFSSISNTVNGAIFPSATNYSQIPLLASPFSTATVLPQAVISIVKNGPAVNPQPNDQFAYELVVTNAGSTSVVFDLSDTLPSNDVTFVSATRNGSSISPSGAACASLGLCDFTSQTISASSTLTYLITVQIQSGAANTFVNTGSISTADATAIVSVPQDTALVTLAGLPDLFIQKLLLTAPSSIVQSGDTVQFSVTYGNSGAESLTDVIITDVFGPQLLYVGGTLGGVTPTQVGNTLTFTGLSIGSGVTLGPDVLTFQVNGTVSEGQNFDNTASIALPSIYPAGYEPNTSNNTDNATGTILGNIDIFVSKSIVGATPTFSGDTVTYQVTIGNSGDATRDVIGDITITDTFQSDLTFVSSTIAPTTSGGTSAAWTFPGTFAPGQTQTFNVTFALNNGLPAGTLVLNTGIVAITSGPIILEPNTTNNTDNAAFLVGDSPELTISKTASPTSLTGIVGSPVVYTITYQNLGTSVASPVVITDTLPSSITPVTPLPQGGTVNGNTVTWTIPSIGTGSAGSGTIVFTGTLNTVLSGGTLVNNVAIDPSNVHQEAVETNNTGAASVTIIPVADMAITSKVIVNQGPPVSGSVTTFAVNYVNNGSITGDIFAIVDTLPSIFDWGGVCTGQHVFLCNQVGNGNLTGVMVPVGPGETGQIVYDVILNTQPVGTVPFTNFVELFVNDGISVFGVDGNPNNNTGSVSGQFDAALDIQVTKTLDSLVASGGVDMSGALATFTVTILNNGDIPVSGDLTDIWPSLYLTNNNSSLNFTGLSLATGSSQSFIFSGNLFNSSLVSFDNLARFDFTVNGTGFSETGTATLTVPQPSCGNQILEANEQCEVIGSTIYGNTPILSGQECVACQVQTTSILNTAQMCIGPGLSECDTSSVLVPVGLPTPDVNITKSVTPSVNLSSGDTVTYTIVLGNSGDTVNNVVFEDIWPWTEVAYVSHTTSPSFNLFVDTVAQTMSGTIPTFASGATYTITIVGEVQTNTVGTVDNIATATYTNNLNQTVVIQDNALINIGQGGLCNAPIMLGSRVLRDDEAEIEVTCEAGAGASSSTQIIIDCGNGDEFTGAGTTFTETCTYDDDDEYTVSCTIDGYTDDSCEDEIDIIDPEVNICGDGIVSQFEDCDLGDDQEEDVYVTIDDILGFDLDGDEIDSDEYEGASCYNCAIISETNPVTPPVCNYTDTSLSVMAGELLPFRWDVEVDRGTIESIEDCDQDELGSVIRNSMICEFAIIHNNGNDEVIDTVSFPCDQELDYDIFDAFKSTTSAHTNVEDAYGQFLIEMNENIDSFGEYKIRLNKVHYNYCALEDGEYSSIKGIPFCRVCETNFAVTRPYLMQVGASSAAATDSLEDFYDIRGDQILTSSELGDIDDVRYSDYDGGGNIDTLLDSFVDKYDALGVSTSLSAFNGGSNVEKVPGKNIFIVNGNVTYEHNTSLGSATIIVKGGDLEVKGNVLDNIMFIVPDGTISFRDDSCERQITRGIFVAGDGFETLDSDERQKNDDAHDEWCDEGGLTVEGVMVGDNIEDLVLSKRSHLNHWFTFEDSAFGNDDDERKERRNEIINGASLLIRYNSSLWTSLPPGGNEIVETLNISKN